MTVIRNTESPNDEKFFDEERIRGRKTRGNND
jgi:hypothetical protein